jgi:hypothetical protein
MHTFDKIIYKILKYISNDLTIQAFEIWHKDWSEILLGWVVNWSSFCMLWLDRAHFIENLVRCREEAFATKEMVVALWHWWKWNCWLLVLLACDYSMGQDPCSNKLHGQHDHSVERRTLGVHSDGSSNDGAPEEGFLRDRWSCRGISTTTIKGNTTVSAVITSWELLTKWQTITFITNGSDKLPWLPTISSQQWV